MRETDSASAILNRFPSLMFSGRSKNTCTRAELQVQVFFDLPENMSEGNRFKIADAVEEARKNDSSEEGS